MITAGGGISIVLVTKQAGKSHAWPDWPPLGNGGTSMTARRSRTTTARASKSKTRPDERRRRFLAGSTGWVAPSINSILSGLAPGSVVTLAPLCGGPGGPLSSILFVQLLEEPGHQSPAADRATCPANREPNQDEDRDRPQALV